MGKIINFPRKMTHQKHSHQNESSYYIKTTGTLVFYTKAFYMTILFALGTIAKAQTSGTIKT